jgi:hypothetical protein
MTPIVVGTKVEGVWGAMYPTSQGEIISIEYGDATIQWNNDDDPGMDLQVVTVSKIHPQGWTSVNGSPIGIFVAEDDSFSDDSYRDFQKLVAKHNPPH